MHKKIKEKNFQYANEIEKRRKFSPGKSVSAQRVPNNETHISNTYNVNDEFIFKTFFQAYGHKPYLTT